jgi:hypothetical protein
MSCFSSYFEFYPGEDKELEITLNEHDKLKNCKEPFDLTGVANTDIIVEVPATPSNIVFTGADVQIVSAIKGEIKVPIASAYTTMMQNGPIKITVTKLLKKKIFVANGACKRLIIGNC